MRQSCRTWFYGRAQHISRTASLGNACSALHPWMYKKKAQKSFSNIGSLNIMVSQVCYFLLSSSVFFQAQLLSSGAGRQEPTSVFTTTQEHVLCETRLPTSFHHMNSNASSPPVASVLLHAIRLYRVSVSRRAEAAPRFPERYTPRC